MSSNNKLNESKKRRSRLKNNDSENLALHSKYTQRFINDDEKQRKNQIRFMNLLESLRIKAANLTRTQSNFPKIDLTAIYCLGVAVQEYIHFQNMSLVDEKRALENEPPLATLFTKEELKSHQLRSVLKRYHSSLLNVQSDPKTDFEVTARPKLEEEVAPKARVKKMRMKHKVNVKTLKDDSEFERLVKTPEWNAFAKKRRITKRD
ncbi:MAG: hypothetical protein EXX96DRAFT_549330, partial [Benjaminiella poitrasii]